MICGYCGVKIKVSVEPGAVNVHDCPATLELDFGNFHNEKSILSEHYGFTPALIEKMQDSNEDCHEHVEESDYPEDFEPCDCGYFDECFRNKCTCSCHRS